MCQQLALHQPVPRGKGRSTARSPQVAPTGSLKVHDTWCKCKSSKFLCAVCKVTDCGHCYINLHRLTIAATTNTTFVTPSKGKEKKGSQKGKDKTLVYYVQYLISSLFYPFCSGARWY